MPDQIRVLYIDDEPGLLELGKLFLEEQGTMAVTTADSVPAGLAHLAAAPVDVVVSDYLMPDMDGIAFLKEVRKTYGDLPFILFTGRGREIVVIDAINNGVDFYLQKGGEPKSQFAELGHKIRQADRRYRSEQALHRSEERYRSVVNDQEDMIARFTPDGALTFVNRAFWEYFGPVFGIQDFIGKNIHDLMREKNSPGVEQRLQKFTPENNISHTERMFTGTGGEQRWQTWSVRAHFNENGTPAEYQAVGHDITRIRKTEEELRAAYEQLMAQEKELRQQYKVLALNESVLTERETAYRTIFEQSPAAITLSTMAGEYVDVNDRFCELVNLPRSVLVGKTPREIWPSFNTDTMKDTLAVFDQSGGVLDKQEMQIPFGGGPPRSCRISSRIVQYHGEPHLLALIYDIGTGKGK